MCVCVGGVIYQYSIQYPYYKGHSNTCTLLRVHTDDTLKIIITRIKTLVVTYVIIDNYEDEWRNYTLHIYMFSDDLTYREPPGDVDRSLSGNICPSCPVTVSQYNTWAAGSTRVSFYVSWPCPGPLGPLTMSLISCYRETHHSNIYMSIHVI